MSRLRDAAAMFVESGRTIGHLELSRSVAVQLARVAALAASEGESVLAERLQAVAQGFRETEPQLERLAAAAQSHAKELLAELEQPGASLARRILGAARAAQRAWREHRG